MFTGIVTDIGRIRSISKTGGMRLEIETNYDPRTIDIGASIASDGVCLTVVDKGADWYAVNVSEETTSKTTIGDWVPGRRINLERALRLGDELGGHIVSGHVDGVGSITGLGADGESLRVSIEAPQALAAFIAPKGSVTINGVSLTVNEVEGARFGINIIPHTQQQTTFGDAKMGERVNLEIDVLARYVARLAAVQEE